MDIAGRLRPLPIVGVGCHSGFKFLIQRVTKPEEDECGDSASRFKDRWNVSGVPELGEARSPALGPRNARKATS
jgi:hypothetical protein